MQRIARLPHWVMPLVVAVVSALGIWGAENWLRSIASGELESGYLIQMWTSNWTMQNLGIEDLLAFGPRGLWLEHLYPPLADAIRYVLVQPDAALLHLDAPDVLAIVQRKLDIRIYGLYAGLYGVVNAVVYLWVRDITRSGWWAGAVTILWAIAPGYVMSMTLLEPTPLALTFLTLAYYFLYRFLRTRRLGYSSAFFAAVLGASLSRNITQWHVLIVLAAALVTFWFIASKRAWWVQALNVVLFGLLLVMPIKQFVLYDTLDTSTYSGYHRAGTLWIDPRTVAEPAYPQDVIDNALVFSSRQNTQETLKDNYRLTKASNEKLMSDPIGSIQALAKSLTITVPEFLRPESGYTQNHLVDRMPWKPLYDWVFSGWRYIVIVLGSIAAIVALRGWRPSLHLVRRFGWFVAWYAMIAAPVLWSNRYWPGQEDQGAFQTDAIRLKVFLEVPLTMLLTYAAWLAVGRMRARRVKANA